MGISGGDVGGETRSEWLSSDTCKKIMAWLLAFVLLWSMSFEASNAAVVSPRGASALGSDEPSNQERNEFLAGFLSNMGLKNSGPSDDGMLTSNAIPMPEGSVDAKEDPKEPEESGSPKARKAPRRYKHHDDYYDHDDYGHGGYYEDDYEEHEDEDPFYKASVDCRFEVYPYASDPKQCSEVAKEQTDHHFEPDVLLGDLHKHTGGACYWDFHLAKLKGNKKGCLCPRKEYECKAKKQCYWFKYKTADHKDDDKHKDHRKHDKYSKNDHDNWDRYGRKDHDGHKDHDDHKDKKDIGVCMHNSERFYNLMARLLAKRGKKQFALNIKYNSAPARGKLPYGPHGPAIIGFGEGLGKEFDKVYPDDAYNYQFDDKFDPLLWLGYNHPERDHHNDKHGRKGHKGHGYSRGGYGGGYGHFGHHGYGYGKHSDHDYDDHEDDHYGHGDDDHYGHGDDYYDHKDDHYDGYEDDDYDDDHYGYQDKYSYGDSYGRHGRHRYRHYGGPFYGSYLPPYHFNSPQFPWPNAYQNVAATNNYGTGYFNQQIQPGTKYQTVGYQTNYPTSTTQNPGHYQAPVSETQYPGSQYNGGSRQDFGVPQGTYPTPQYAENHQVPLPEAQYPANQYPAPNPEPHYPAGQYNNPGAVPQGDVYPTGYQPPKVEPTQTAEVPVYQKPSPEPHYQFPLDPYQAATYDPTYRNPQSIGYNPVHPQMPHIHPGQSPQGLQHPMSIPNSGVPLSPPYVRGTPPKMPEAVQQPEYAPPPAEAVAEHEGEEALPAGASYPSPKAQPLTLQYMRGLSDFLNNH